MSYSSHFRYKVVLFGDIGVGKTSLVIRFINDKFDENLVSTIGYNVYEKSLIYNECLISLMIFDFGGQERFANLRRYYARGANAAFIVFDLTSQKSFENLIKWKNDLFGFTGEIPFIVIGNKADLESEWRVRREDILKVCSSIGALAYYETSAKTGKAVEDAFYQLGVKTYTTHAKGLIYG
ncbi:MAG: GTP-binding protein [Candidatus Helarchaeota archaeon]|nr:GTP-binding protein [Candidatus Helarchaeota archaeon]